MICSVLIPSRTRPDRLLKTIESIYNTVSYAKNIEIILRFDMDDDETLSRLKEFKVSKIIIGERKKGYSSLNVFYTEMAAIAKGKWIWIMNDDAEVVGKNWDIYLGLIPLNKHIVQPELYQLGNSQYFDSEGSAFPIVPNEFWKLFGHKEIASNKIDTWFNEIALSNGWTTRFLEGIGTVHDRDAEDILAMHRDGAAK